VNLLDLGGHDMDEKLKPCPFCGDDYASQVFNGTTPKVIDFSDQYVSSFWVTCNNCDTEGPVGNTEIEAIRKWNCRPMENTLKKGINMPVYKVPVNWEVYGVMDIMATTLQEAVDKAEDYPYPTTDENIEGSQVVNFGMLPIMNPEVTQREIDHIIKKEFEEEKSLLTCPECGGKIGQHFMSCSVYEGVGNNGI